MVYGAIDLHLRYSQIRIIDADGRVVREQRVVTSRETLTAAFAGLGPMRMLLETGTESEWVAQALEAAGHEVIVADPNYAPMYGELRRRGEDRSARRGGAGGGESARAGIGRRIGGRRRSGRCSRSCGAGGSWCDADRDDLAAARAAAARGLSAAVGERGAGAGAAGAARRCRRRWRRRSRRCGR